MVGRAGSVMPRRNNTAATDNMPDSTKAAGAPVQAISAPANAGPAAKAALRASSKRPLARASPSTGTKAGTSEGAAGSLYYTAPVVLINIFKVQPDKQDALLDLLSEKDPALRALDAREKTQRVHGLTVAELKELDF